jgi:hypothetical protein
VVLEVPEYGEAGRAEVVQLSRDEPRCKNGVHAYKT